jgi:hypothetical protein
LNIYNNKIIKMKKFLKITIATFAVAIIVFNVFVVKENRGRNISLSSLSTITTANAETKGANCGFDYDGCCCIAGTACGCLLY